MGSDTCGGWPAAATPRHYVPDTTTALRQVFTQPLSLMAGAERVGDPIAVLPVLYHLLWRHHLTTDLTVPLNADTLVGTLTGASTAPGPNDSASR